jgi:hypothetical protein
MVHMPDPAVEARRSIRRIILGIRDPVTRTVKKSQS